MYSEDRLPFLLRSVTQFAPLSKFHNVLLPPREGPCSGIGLNQRSERKPKLPLKHAKALNFVQIPHKSMSAQSAHWVVNPGATRSHVKQQHARNTIFDVGVRGFSGCRG